MGINVPPRVLGVGHAVSGSELAQSKHSIINGSLVTLLSDVLPGLEYLSLH